MNILRNNPFRIIGLLVGATAREQEKQIRRLKQFIEAEQDNQDDFSFPILGEIHRTIENVTEAASKLNLDGDKMNAALFWFYNGNAITDEPAFEAIKDGNPDIAIGIWRKLVYDSQDDSYNKVSKRNASAFHNLSTYYLYEFGIDEETLELKLLFLESDFFNELKLKATDEIYKTSKKELQLLFLNNLTRQDNFDISEFIDAIINIEFLAKEDFLKWFAQRPIEQLEFLIHESIVLRKAKKEQVINAGTNLFNAAQPILNQLEGLLGASHFNFISISDKISDEVLQCGIQLFNDYKEHNTYEPGEPAKLLFEKARKLAVGHIIKQRIEENVDNVEEWMDEKPERDRLKLIEKDLKKLIEIFEAFEQKKESIANAVKIIRKSLLFLKNIRTQVGRKDPVYINLSTKIASLAQHNIIEEVNRAQESAKGSNLSFITLPPIFSKAWEASELVGQLDMDLDFRNEQYSRNRNILKEICQTLRVDIRPVEVRLNEELRIATNEMDKIKEWQFLRNESDRRSQINVQQKKIDLINARLRDNKTST